ncbi:hypothetical protein [Sphingopyxis sp.]|uniref:hypothetical protein n=1 Tax=Sphingopyxis sp. TaxID=1908224 RepID=UPI003BA9FB15
MSQQSADVAAPPEDDPFATIAIPKVPASDLIPPDTVRHLVSVAYGGTIPDTVQRGEVSYSVEPGLAFHTPDRIILIVRHKGLNSSHADTGHVSVFFFARDGKTIISKMPFVAFGSDWGMPPEVAAIAPADGAFGMITAHGGGQHGESCEWLSLYVFKDDKVTAGSSFPGAYDNVGITAEISSSRWDAARQTLAMDYRIKRQKIDGLPGDEVISKSIRLREIEPAWARRWPYTCGGGTLSDLPTV